MDRNKIHSQILQEHMKYLWENSLLFDVVITQNSSIIAKAHKVILGAFSDHFFSLLSSKEASVSLSRQPGIPVQEVELNEFDKDNICHIVKFLYTGCFDENVLQDTDRLEWLVKDANKLNFKAVVSYIHSYHERVGNTSGSEASVEHSLVGDNKKLNVDRMHGGMVGGKANYSFSNDTSTENEVTFCIEYKDTERPGKHNHDSADTDKQNTPNTLSSSSGALVNNRLNQSTINSGVEKSSQTEINFSDLLRLNGDDSKVLNLSKDGLSETKVLDSSALFTLLAEKRSTSSKRKKVRPRKIESPIVDLAPLGKRRKKTPAKRLQIDDDEEEEDGLSELTPLSKVKLEVVDVDYAADYTQEDSGAEQEQDPPGGNNKVPLKWEEAEESNDNVDNSDDNDDANDDYDEDTEFDDDIDDGNDEDYLPEESIPHLDEVVDLKVDIDGQEADSGEHKEEEETQDSKSKGRPPLVKKSRRLLKEKGKAVKLRDRDVLRKKTIRIKALKPRKPIVEPAVKKEKRRPRLIVEDYLEPDGTYKCSKCGRSYSSVNCFRRHYQSTHSDKKRFECTYCEKKFSDSFKLKEHTRVHTGERPYVCATCGSAFKAKKHLNKHMKLHNRSERVPCTYEECLQSFVDKDQLNRHVRQVHLKLKPFKCDHPECRYAAADNSMLKYHKQTHLPLDQRKTQLCSICGASVPGPSTNLKVHMIKHSNEWFSCPVCNYKTKYKTYLQSHITRRHGIDSKGEAIEKSMKCPHCNFSCYFQHEYNFHIKKHAIDKPFKCKICEYSCITQSQMNAHMRTHTGSKPYICDFCGKGFTQSTHLSRHRRTHTGERPHKCKECGQGFIEKRYLERHMYSQHLGIKPYMCHVCTYSCIKRDTLKNHIRSAHGEAALPDNMRGRVKQKVMVKDLPYEQQLSILGQDGMHAMAQLEKIKKYEPRRTQSPGLEYEPQVTHDEPQSSQGKSEESRASPPAPPSQAPPPATAPALPQPATIHDSYMNSYLQQQPPQTGPLPLTTNPAHQQQQQQHESHHPSAVSSPDVKRPMPGSAFQHHQHHTHQPHHTADAYMNLQHSLQQASHFPVNINLQNTMVPAFLSLHHHHAAGHAANAAAKSPTNMEAMEYGDANYKF